MRHNGNNEKLIKNCGLKLTKPRLAVLDIITQSRQPLTAEDVFIKLKNKDININISTVYRTLEALAEKKLLTKLALSGDNRAYFEFNSAEHRHYLVCIGCNKITAIKGCPLEIYEKSLQQETDYKLEWHRLEMYGFCPDCSIASKN